MGIDITPSLLLPLNTGVRKDIGPNGHVISSSNVTLDTAIKKWGAGSTRITGGSNGVDTIQTGITVPASADFSAQSDYTLEFNFRLNAIGQWHTLMGSRDGWGSWNLNIGMLVNDSNKLFCTGSDGASVQWAITSVGSLVADTWYHVRLTYSTVDGWEVLLDGVSIGTAVAANKPPNISRILDFGHHKVGSNTFWTFPADMWIDDIRFAPFRVRKGEFLPHTRAHNVRTFCNWDQYRSQRAVHIIGDSLTDHSDNSFALANNGSTFVTNDLPFGPRVIDFNGASYIGVPDDPAWDFGVNDLTIEGIIKFDSLGGGICGISDGGGDQLKWALLMDQQGHDVTLYQFSFGSITSNRGFPWPRVINRWYHFAMVRRGDDWRFFSDGQQQGNTHNEPLGIISSQLNLPMRVGTDGEGFAKMNGQMAEFIVYPGVSKYWESFTPHLRPHCT